MNPQKDWKAKLERAHFLKFQCSKITVCSCNSNYHNGIRNLEPIAHLVCMYSPGILYLTQVRPSRACALHIIFLGEPRTSSLHRDGGKSKNLEGAQQCYQMEVKEAVLSVISQNCNQLSDFLVFSIFPKNERKNSTLLLWYIPQVGLFLFVFFGELKTPKTF